MERMKAILSDTDLPEVFFSIHHALEDDYWPRVVSFHDDENAEPHIHWSILSIEDGVVIDWDWGYHSENEARSYILKEEGKGDRDEP